MAPRARTRKRGSQTRMDAALDAMRPFGFPRNLVRRTVGELLEVYGGDEGWVFVEEAAYTLLIETMLEKQDNAPREEQDGLNQADSRNDDQTEVIAAGSSNSVLVDAESQTNETIYQRPGCCDCDSKHLERSVVLSESDGEVHPKYLPVFREAAESLPVSLTVADGPEPSKPVESVGQRKRKPFYGWISNEEDEDDDIIHLTPSPFTNFP